MPAICSAHIARLQLLASLAVFAALTHGAAAQAVDVPGCVANGALVSIIGPAASLAACQATARRLNTDPANLNHSVTFMTPFACAACVPVSANSSSCIATLTALVQPLKLLQVRCWPQVVLG